MTSLFFFIHQIFGNIFGTINAPYVENQIAGVLSLMRNSVPDLIANGFVSVSASHHYDINNYPSTCLVQTPSTTYWNSLNSPDEWFQVDFESMNVYCTHYALRSRDLLSHFPKSWKLEGSNDGSTWSLLHNEPSTSVFCSSYQVATFVCTSPGEYSKFRVTMTDVNSNGANYFLISSVDFFGVLNGGLPTATSFNVNHFLNLTCDLCKSSFTFILFLITFFLLGSSFDFHPPQSQFHYCPVDRSYTFSIQYYCQ